MFSFLSRICQGMTVLGICCAVLLGGPFPSAQAQEAKPAAPPLSVRVIPVRTVESAATVRVPGTVEAVERSTIAARINATITAVPVKLGSRVEPGEVLVQLRADELNARAAQARAQLEQVRRNLARENRLLAQQAATAESVRNLRDSERIAAAALREAEAMLAYTRITAPYAGLVSRKMVNSGDLAAPGMPLLELESASALQVRAQAPEEVVAILQQDDLLTVLFPATGEQMQAQLQEISPAANPAVRSATIILALANGPEMSSNLRSGQYVQVLLPGGASRQIMLVPAAAVSSWGQMERVFVLEDNRARLRLVRTGARMGEEIEINSGLSAGEQVILGVAGQLAHDRPVQVQP